MHEGGQARVCSVLHLQELRRLQEENKRLLQAVMSSATVEVENLQAENERLKRQVLLWGEDFWLCAVACIWGGTRVPGYRWKARELNEWGNLTLEHVQWQLP